jgi:hypothetical protein
MSVLASYTSDRPEELGLSIPVSFPGEFFFRLDVNQNFFHLRHAFQNRTLHVMSDAMSFPNGKIAADNHV